MSLISHEACKELEDYLLARLRKGNASAKHKCLQIMKHVCRAGRADFKRDLQRQAEVGGWVGGVDRFTHGNLLCACMNHRH